MIDLLKRIKRRLFRLVFPAKPTPYIPPPPYHCPVCNQAAHMSPLHPMYMSKLQEHRFVHNIFLSETINLENYKCAQCGASDRERLYALYLNKYLPSKQVVNLLDIAPAPPLARYLKKFTHVRYRSTDLSMAGVDDLQDLTDMHSYKEGQFDFFICSHVLEHVPDDRKAMSELFRVLKKGGKGIAMVPINLGVEKTMEDPTITDVGGKWKYFGQGDHVRMYAKSEFIQRLSDAGFNIELLDIHYFGEAAFQTAAIFNGSVLYIVTK